MQKLNNFPKILVKDSNIATLYGYAIEIALTGNKERAMLYLKDLTEFIKDGLPESEKQGIEKIVLDNIGYWGGYYKNGVEKVFEIYGVEHPIFGKITPSPKEAFKMGIELGKSLKNK